MVRRISRKWPDQDTNSRSSELLDAKLAEGPQIVTKRGVGTAVLLRFVADAGADDKTAPEENAPRP